MTAQPLASPLPAADDAVIWDVWQAQHRFPALYAADQLGLFAFLDQRPATIDEVERGVALGPRGARALLALLTALGLLERKDERYAVAERARDFVVPGRTFYWGGLITRAAQRPVTPERLLDALRREPAGTGPSDELWEEHAVDADAAAAFTRGIHAQSFAPAAGVARAGDFSGVKRLLDVGGGSGAVAIALVLAHPELHVTLLDIPAVLPIATDFLREWDVEDRVDLLACDMFNDDWPDGYDAALFSNVLHDWNRERQLQLLRSAHAALPSGGRVYVNEVLLAESLDGPATAAAFSLNMILLTEGDQPTGSDMAALLREAGFDDVTVRPTEGYYSLVSARKR